MRRRPLTFVLLVTPALRLASAQTPESQIQENTILLSGSVALSDNSPAAAVLVRRVCKSRVEAETWTDAEGRYSFKIDGRKQSGGASGDATQAVPVASDIGRPFGNASQYSNPVTSALRDCEITAILAGYRSDAVPVTVRSTMDDTRIPTIRLHPLSRADALTVSVTTEKAPKNARRAYEKAAAEIKAGRWDAAERDLTQAVKEYPVFAAAWFDLGIVREKRGASAGAVQAWQRAVDADNRYLLPYEKLATYADGAQQWEDAARYSAAWIRLDPDDFPGAYLVHAVSSARLNRPDEAERSARAGLSIDKNRHFPRLNYVLGLLLAGKRQYAESAEQFREYLKYAPDARDAGAVRAQLAVLEQAAGASRQQP